MLITHGRIATFGQNPQVIEDGAICIAGDQIIAVGPTAELKARYPEAEQLDASGQLVLPGSICAHTHFYGAFARGMAIPGAPARNFVEILQKLWWRLDRALDEESIRLSALVCLVDAIRNGTTTLIDHHASPNLIDGSLDICAEAIAQSGLRVCECYEVTDRNGPEGAQAGIAENVRFARQLAARPNPLLAASFGLHASFTIGLETLERCVAEAQSLGLGFHVHVAEDNADEIDSETKYGQRVGEHLSAKGVLGEKTLSAHCVHVNQNEINLLAKTNTKVSHQPRSNMNNAVGTAPVQQMLDSGVCVGLGNDGFSNNMYSEMKAAYLVHKSAARDPRAMPGDTVHAPGLREQCAHRLAVLAAPARRDRARRVCRSRVPRLLPVHAADRRQPALADHLWRRWHARHDDDRGRQSADARSGLADARRGAHRRAGARNRSAGLAAL